MYNPATQKAKATRCLYAGVSDHDLLYSQSEKEARIVNDAAADFPASSGRASVKPASVRQARPKASKSRGEEISILVRRKVCTAVFL